ncbi:MAG: sugar kinase [Nocardiopsaceae bacterium]|nr:sugar kinase [Nocardiopsaceae bacterium]
MPPAQSPPAPPVPGGHPRRLVFAGEAIVDVSMRVPAFPAPGADILAESSGVAVGGGFSVMAAAARQGLPVLYAGGHGTGPWGDLVREALAAEGIEVFRSPDPLRDTGFTVALSRPGDASRPGGAERDADVERDAERAYVTRLGAESAREPGCMDDIPVTEGDAVYISGYGLIPPESGPVVAEWASALPPGALLFCDPGPLAGQIPVPLLARVLPRCDWLSCTAREAVALTGIEDPADAARALLGTAKGGRARNVIVRTGPSGCLLALRGRSESAVATPIAVATCRSSAGAWIVRVPAPAVAAVDTTGAGDAHAGAFLAALADGLPPDLAARRANAAAALSVTRQGPATAPTRATLDAWLAS